MIEKALFYQVYVSRQLKNEELLQLVATVSSTEVANVKCLVYQACDSKLEIGTYCAGAGRTLTLRYYPEEKLYCIDAWLMGEDDMGYADVRDIEVQVCKFLKNSGALSSYEALSVPLRRGNCLWRYKATADERILEPAFSKLVAEVDSKFQNVKIYESSLHGRALYLDDDVMLSDADQEAYTRVLLGIETGKPARNNFENKEILILGGGDGNTLCQLLKQRPKMVVMCEIDEEVVKLCRQHMRDSCEDAFDTYEGPNKKIIFGDCVEYLHQCIQSGKKFDFIVNDLTEFIVNTEKRGWDYNLATENSQVMEFSMKALKQDGKYLARGGAIAPASYWQQLEADCPKIGCEFSSIISYVPGFYQDYKLYEVWFAKKN